MESEQETPHRESEGKDVPELPPVLAASDWTSTPATNAAVARVLQECEARFRALAQAAGEMFVTATANGEAREVTDWCRFTGQRQEEALGRGWLEAVHPDDRAASLRAWEHALAAPNVFSFENRVRRADGAYRICHHRFAPVHAANGDVREWIGICADITERAQARHERIELHERERTARKQAEALNAQLRVVLDVLPIGLSIADASGHVAEINPAFREIWGENAPRPDGVAQYQEYKGWWSASGERIRAEEWAMARALLTGEVITHDEIDIETFDGKRKTVLNNAAPIRDDMGKIVGAVVAIVDITERKQLFEALRASEQRAITHARLLEAALESMTDGIIIYDTEGRILSANSAARALLEIERRPDYLSLPLEQRTRIDVPYDDDGRELPCDAWPLKRILRGEVLTESSTSTYHLHKDGYDQELSVTGTPVRNAEGEITGAVCAVRDITERKRLERRTREALEAMLEVAETLVLAPMDPVTAQAPTAEPAASALTPGQAHDAEDEGIPLSPPMRGTELPRHLASLIRSMLSCSVVTFITMDPDTQQLTPLAVTGFPPELERRWWHDWQGNPVLSQRLGEATAARLARGEVVTFEGDETQYPEVITRYHVREAMIAPMSLGSHLMGYIGLGYDGAPHAPLATEQRMAGAVAKLAALTVERERLLREREEARAHALALREANRRMDEFLGIAAHELRTPVTVIKATMQLFAKRLERKAAAMGEAPRALPADLELLGRIDRHLRRLSRLVDDLVDVSRIREGKLELRLERCDLAEIVREAIEEELWAQPERVIQTHLPMEQPIYVMADADRIRQAITNYLTNALKYSSAEQPVTVRLSLADGEARVAVTDRGMGIPEDELPHVWELFHRAAGVQVQSGSGIGLGLGLHISERITERHGGRVGVESTAGEGSTFWFTLPLAGEREAGD